MQVQELVSLDISGFKTAGGGRYKSGGTFYEMLRSTGKHGCVLSFPTREERMKYVIGVLKPFSRRIDVYLKHQITSWLKSNGLRYSEVLEIYRELGLYISLNASKYGREKFENPQILLPDRADDRTLYELWRYKDVSLETLSARYGIPIDALRDKFGEMFYQKCMSAKDSCVFSKFLEEIEPRPTCSLEGCQRLTNWGGKWRKWNRFCSIEHANRYNRNHPTQASLRIEKKLMEILEMIKSGKIKSQIDLRELSLNRNASRDASKWAIAMEKRGLIGRRKALINGKWSYLLIQIG